MDQIDGLEITESFSAAGDEMAKLFDALVERQENLNNLLAVGEVDAPSEILVVSENTQIDNAQIDNTQSDPEGNFEHFLYLTRLSGMAAAETNLATTVVTNASSALRRLQSGN